MRVLSSDIITKSAQQDQTIAAEAEPYVSLRISRNRTILTDMNLTEKVKVRTAGNGDLTDADIAVQHPRFKGENTKIWCVLINDGKLGLRWTYDREDITETKWNVINLGAPTATACAIGFDSEVKENARGYAEFVTGDGYPLVFYVDGDGALKCIILGGAIIEETLAAENVTDVSVIRGPSSKNGSWDLGLTVFFLMGGALFYRQLINGVWYDAEQVNLTITGETFSKIDAFVTWDYRVGVQVLTASGKLYQIISYTEGIGVRGTEHIEMKMFADVSLTGIEYHNEFTNEHISMVMSASTALIYGHSALPVSVANVEDEDENWGTTIEVQFDYPNTIGTADETMFTLVDSNNINYTCESVALSADGLTLILTFQDFNLAARAEDITLTYTAPASGGLQSPAVQTASFTETFEPENLVSLINPPTFVNAWNDSKGEKIYVRFSEVLTAGISNSNASSYGLNLHEYNYVPEGTIEDTTRTVASVNNKEADSIDLTSGSLTNTECINHVLKLEAD
ncbi:MAG: hypothetical protein IKX20_11130 [Paludibacteraceae bacterium]|nr:hypothetical protein [Paludibacteraceae bacterium]